jgi:hypothetical protein
MVITHALAWRDHPGTASTSQPIQMAVSVRRNRRPIPAPVGNKANPMLGSTIDIFPLGW